MRIAFVSIADPSDPYAWSGINHSVSRRLAAAGAEILPVGPLHSLHALAGKARTAFTRLLPTKRSRYLWTLNPDLLRAYARQVERRLQTLCPDVVFSPGTQPIAYLDSKWPVVFWTDAPFAAMRGYYPWYAEVSDASLRDGMACDDRALQLCQAACYSSAWAAQAAVSEHHADPAKVHVLPFGANLDQRLDVDGLEEVVSRRLAKPWRFLFVGVEWARKGGDLALAVVRLLNERGHPAELIVIGCQPPAGLGALPDYVHVLGFVSQHSDEGRRQLVEMFRSSLFYLMPSQAEAYGIVFCEANALGLPCLSTATGGVPTIIENGENGQLFDPDAGPEAYVDFILAHSEPAAYRLLVEGALQAYDERLSWERNIPRLNALLTAAAAPSNCLEAVSHLV